MLCISVKIKKRVIYYSSVVNRWTKLSVKKRCLIEAIRPSLFVTLVSGTYWELKARLVFTMEVVVVVRADVPEDDGGQDLRGSTHCGELACIQAGKAKWHHGG